MKTLSIILLISCSLLILCANLVRFYYSCINVNDFAIYQQAIYEIAFGPFINPYLSIRNIAIFNDHFDPIILIPSLLLKLIGPNAYALMVWEWLHLPATLAFYAYTQKIKSITDKKLLSAAALLVFCRALLDGLEFPIHPTTWTILPFFISTYAVYNKKTGLFLFSQFLLCFYKEYIPITLFPVSLYFFLHQRKTFYALILMGTVFSSIIFLRPYFLGPVIPYGKNYLAIFFANPISSLWQNFLNTSFPIKAFIVPFILSLIIIYKERSSFPRHPLMIALLQIAPPVFVHLLAQRYAHHHKIPMVIPIIAVFLYSKSFDQILDNTKHLRILLLIAFFTSTSRFQVAARHIVQTNYYNCHKTSHKRTQLDEILEFRKVVGKRTVLATSGIIPTFLLPGMELYPISDVAKVLKSTDFLLIEKDGAGDIYPLSKEDLKGLSNRCAQYTSKVHLDNDYYQLLEGPFPQSCIRLDLMFDLESALLPGAKFQK